MGRSNPLDWHWFVFLRTYSRFEVPKKSYLYPLNSGEILPSIIHNTLWCKLFDSANKLLNFSIDYRQKIYDFLNQIFDSLNYTSFLSETMSYDHNLIKIIVYIWFGSIYCSCCRIYIVIRLMIYTFDTMKYIVDWMKYIVD